jgi:hypothetical protein
MELEAGDAFRLVGEFARSGYPCRCVPPVTVTR